jgi:PelA/Pel-15E family pectate lyase
MNTTIPAVLVLAMLVVPQTVSQFRTISIWREASFHAQYQVKSTSGANIDTIGFWDSAHHWYSIADEDRVITPLSNQQRYKSTDITKIADNILLYQKTNGGWPKNYDMLAILTEEQERALKKARKDANTTFDNGATHSQVEYLAKAYSIAKDKRYKDACLRGLDFILAAQYANGGWPQCHPDSSGYRRYITFNDGAMIGVMNALHHIVQGKPYYAFVDRARRDQVRSAFAKGLDCILKCQIVQNGRPTAWCQQHDDADYRPRAARTFEPAAVCGGESAEIVLFLMSLDHPTGEVIASVQSAVKWFNNSKVRGIRVQKVKAPTTQFKYHTADFDRVVVRDPKVPPIWARFYELSTNTPLFSNRDGKPVYSLADVDRERRTGYEWYTYAPEQALKNYPSWQKKWAPSQKVLEE